MGVDNPGGEFDMSADDPGGVVGFRLVAVEKRLDRMETSFNSRLDSIQGAIGTLSFVRKDVYESDQRAAARDMLALTEKVESARAIAMWALGTTLTAVALIGTLVGLLKVLTG